MVDLASGRQLDRAIEVHTVELGKDKLSGRSIAQSSKIEQWALLILYAQDYDSSVLKELLPGIEFEQAMATIAIISAKTEDRTNYDQREKAQRDYEWAISGAREEGREEGEQFGLLNGKIQMLEQLIGDKPTTDAEFRDSNIETLTTRLTKLQQRIGDRQA